MTPSFHTDRSERPAPKSPSSPSGGMSGDVGTRKSSSLGLIVAIVTVAVVLLWLARQGHLPGPLRDWLPGSSDSLLFVAQPDLTQDQAAALYRQAVVNLQNGETETALTKFKRLEPAYPALKDILWLRQAECYALQGNEWAVQKKLNDLIAQLPQSPLKTVALYRIGQSRFRGNEPAKALETFLQIRRDNPQSVYATGSLYYLGVIEANNPKTRSEALGFLREYLRLYPTGKFGLETAEALERFSGGVMTPEDHGLVGLAYAASSKDAARTLAHLRQGDIKLTWHVLGKNQIRSGQMAQGVQTLVTGLPYAHTADETTEAVDAILAATSSTERKISLLKTIHAKPLAFGGDYPLWKLAELAPSSLSNGYYRQLLDQFPQGDYAPESGWHLLWPLLTSGQGHEYVTQARHYLERYAYARSAPKVLFWVGKVLEKSNPPEAAATYQQVRDQYPSSYYAFRAEGRLKAIAGGESDPGWLTEPENSGYPGFSTNINTLDLMPPPERFSMGLAGHNLRAEASELQHIGVPEDVRLFVSEALGELPPAVSSWIEQASGDRAKGIRTLRTALDSQAREAFHLTGKMTEPNSPSLMMPPSGTAANSSLFSADTLTPDAMKLLYPLYFADVIAQAGKRQKLDPFLVQALMREESYFNEFAVSGSNARGLMQLLPATAADVAQWEDLRSFKTADLFLPETNIRLGSRYLSHLHTLFHQNSMPAVGAYNGGPGAMSGWVRASSVFTSDPDMFVERIPYGQSRDYIKKVFAAYWNYRRLYTQ